MPRDVDLSLSEQSFISRAIEGNVRLDGRRLDAFREIEIAFGVATGSADVRLGKTRYLSPNTVVTHI